MSALGARQATDTTTLVITPGGPRPKSLIQYVPAGTVVDITDIKAFTMRGTGETDEEYDILTPQESINSTAMAGRDILAMPNPGNTSLVHRNSKSVLEISPAEASPVDDGIIASASWTNIMSIPVSSFSATWEVPPAPLARTTGSGRHVIYISSGMKNIDATYQPILQWGDNGIGGGQYWMVASWYGSRDGGPVFHSDFVKVQPGDTITGLITHTGNSGSGFNYNCEFVGIPNTSLRVSSVPQLTECFVGLEGYGTNSALSFPRTARTNIRNISITTRNMRPIIEWIPLNPPSSSGQSINILNHDSNNGEIDICYAAVAPWSIVSVNMSSTRIDLFGIGADDAMYHKFWDGLGSGWSTWNSLGGAFTSKPAAVCWANNRIDVFGLGREQAMYHKAWDGTQWQPAEGWENLAGTFTSHPCVTTWGEKRLDVFGLNTDRNMMHKSYDGTSSGTGWSSGWDNLGGVFNSPPAAVCWGPGRIDVFGLGMDNQCNHKWYNGSWEPSQTGWERQGGVFNSPLSVTSWGPNRIDIFGLGAENAMYHKAYDSSGDGWYSWEPLGGVFNSMPSTVCWAANRIDIWGLGSDNSMFHKAWTGSNWEPRAKGWESHGGKFTSAPSTNARAANVINVFGIGLDKAVYHQYWAVGAWWPTQTTWDNLGGELKAS